ncbi:hypothetical protein [Streptomyces sp. NPDC017230]|uniref:hypothetical protein n=1 Tax=unclassified Streptomyces TaxID=2593676 RepID=UPI0037A3A113
MQLPRTQLKPRKLVGLVAGAGLVLTTLLGAAPVQAADSASPAVGSTEQQVGAHAEAGVLANSPGISPAAERVRYVSGNNYSCPTGRLCARVWDPTRNTYKVFDLYYCKTYSLSYWGGRGGFYNYQTDGTAAKFYNSRGAVVHTSIARSTANSGWNWDPIWKIKNC